MAVETEKQGKAEESPCARHEDIFHVLFKQDGCR
jgi:hypothetical protein